MGGNGNACHMHGLLQQYVVIANVIYQDVGNSIGASAGQVTESLLSYYFFEGFMEKVNDT